MIDVAGPACFFFFFFSSIISWIRSSASLEVYQRWFDLEEKSNNVQLIEKNMVFKATAGTEATDMCNVDYITAKRRDFFKWHTVWSKIDLDMVFI